MEKSPQANLQNNGVIAISEFEKLEKSELDSVVRRSYYELTRSDAGMDLPAAKQEGEMLMNEFGFAGFVNEQATKPAIINELGKFDVIHFATHALVNYDLPLLSSLVLHSEADNSENTFLDAADIRTLNLKADLVFLSACQTSLGKDDLQEGSESLAYSFLYAGAKSVIMTQWSIPDETTPQVVIEFYRNLDKGMRKSEALRQAKLTYLANQENPELRHPYYWAGFVLIGEDNEVQLGKDYFWFYVLGILALGITCAWWMKRK